ncbi:hypothetical protein MPSEU_000473300 [Mayamaea pseudoterrestris]|nr:hypothetical protein MPSEU_000473300 [Mayamaea pseudoterrestris]
MWRTWKALQPEQKRVYAAVAGAIIGGSLFKVWYFNFSRKLIVNDSDRQQREGLERLQEARQFAKWSKNDRESRLPQLTAEQRQQMKSYLEIVEQHGLAKAFDNANGRRCEGEGCPVLARARRAVAGVVADSSSS